MNPLGRKLAALALGTSIAGVIGLIGKAHFFPPESPPDPAWVERKRQLAQARPIADEHRERIRAELADGADETWNGIYACSPGLESDVVELSRAGFYYEYEACLGTGELACGDVLEVDGQLIRLRPVLDASMTDPKEARRSRSGFRLEDELFCVPWGQEQFLVPAGHMSDFCARAKSPKAMSYASYPRKMHPGESAWSELSLDGLPTVPAEFRPLLSK